MIGWVRQELWANERVNALSLWSPITHQVPGDTRLSQGSFSYLTLPSDVCDHCPSVQEVAKLVVAGR